MKMKLEKKIIKIQMNAAIVSFVVSTFHWFCFLFIFSLCVYDSLIVCDLHLHIGREVEEVEATDRSESFLSMEVTHGGESK